MEKDLKPRLWRMTKTPERICSERVVDGEGFEPEGIASRFTVCPLWPLGNPSVNEFIIYKEESFCKIFFSFFDVLCQSVFEKETLQSARPTLQYILP